MLVQELFSYRILKDRQRKMKGGREKGFQGGFAALFIFRGKVDLENEKDVGITVKLCTSHFGIINPIMN